MVNKYGNKKNITEFHENGNKSYVFKVLKKDMSYEYTGDKLGNVMTFKSSKGFSYEYTRDESGKALTFKNSKGFSYEFARDEPERDLIFKNPEVFSYECTGDESKEDLIFKDSEEVETGFRSLLQKIKGFFKLK